MLLMSALCSLSSFILYGLQVISLFGSRKPAQAFAKLNSFSMATNLNVQPVSRQDLSRFSVVPPQLLKVAQRTIPDWMHRPLLVSRVEALSFEWKSHLLLCGS